MTETSRDERVWATLCHLSTLVGFVIPFGNIAAPLIIWLLKREEYPLVDDQGKESLNFQLSLTIYIIVSAILILVAIGIALLIALAVFDVVVVILASMRANYGERYRYPLTIRFLK